MRKKQMCRHCGKEVVIMGPRTRVTHGTIMPTGKPLENSKGCCMGIIQSGPYKGREAFLKPANATVVMIMSEVPA